MFSRLTVWLFSLALIAPSLGGTERNRWPLAVEQTGRDGTVMAAQYLGPLFFENHLPGQPAHEGFRPFYLKAQTAEQETRSFVYPLFIWKKQSDFSSFSFFNLINRSAINGSGSPQKAYRQLDVWPFYFSRTNADPATSYQALFPFAGTIKNRFGNDRTSFAGFPLYFHTEKSGQKITQAPWPFVRFIDGAGHHGFEIWPLFGHRGREGDYDRQFYLWPLFYKSVRQLSEPVPTVSVGALPFYTRDTAPGYLNENYLWPFFGYSRRSAPHHYNEQRYFWPFFVQGQGDQRLINRWAPFYTHSEIKGLDKTWVLWPFFRQARWSEEGVAQTKSQLLFVVYWSLEQRSEANPLAAPAHKTHLWPLFSSWDNGAGRQQLQLLSPFEVFFPHNETVRQLYSPLFALYRYERQTDRATRHLFLWNAVSYEHAPQATTFNLGPILTVSSSPESQRVTIARGLFGLKRQPGQRLWRPFLFDFSAETGDKPQR